MSQSLGYGVSVLGIEKHVVAGGRCAEVSHCHTAALPPCLGVSCLPARKMGSAFCICAQRVGKKKKKSLCLACYCHGAALITLSQGLCCQCLQVATFPMESHSKSDLSLHFADLCVLFKGIWD